MRVVTVQGLRIYLAGVNSQVFPNQTPYFSHSFFLCSSQHGVPPRASPPFRRSPGYSRPGVADSVQRVPVGSSPGVPASCTCLCPVHHCLRPETRKAAEIFVSAYGGVKVSAELLPPVMQSAVPTCLSLPEDKGTSCTSLSAWCLAPSGEQVRSPLLRKI
ncbi:hypothetical protein GN956_G4324 [Arapaima gigas]